MWKADQKTWMEKIVLDEHNKRSYLILLFEDQITLYRVFAGGSKG